MGPKPETIEKARVLKEAEFLAKAKEKWGNYDYSMTKYINKETKIIFKCDKHGLVEQLPRLHLKSGCQFCNGRGISKYTKESFAKRGKEVHGDIYDYDKVIINSIMDKVIIYCTICKKDFIQSAKNHINLKNGCPYHKGGVKNTQEEFVCKAVEKHIDKFDYSKVEYKNSHINIKLICKKHNIEFEQMPYMHLQSDICCPACVSEMNESKAELEIKEFIKSLFPEEEIVKKHIAKMEIDIYLPRLKLGFEYNGLYFHREEIIGKDRHFKKTNLAEENDIRLIHINENEYVDKKNIVLSMIKSILGKNDRIYARECECVRLSQDEKNYFLENNHIQGIDNSSEYYGLKHNKELVSCMTFGIPRFNEKYSCELIRYCSKLGISVIGGPSKLFKFADKKDIISYSDRRWFTGKMYEMLGFKFLHRTNPGYFYYNIKNKTVHNRMKFQKHKLKEMLCYLEELSEYDIMKKNGYDRVWNAGNNVYVY